MQDQCFANKVFISEDFHYEKHVSYLLKSLRKAYGLPPELAEAHKLSWVFFVVSGLDLLSALETRLSRADRDDIIRWIYSYQIKVDRVHIHKDLFRSSRDDNRPECSETNDDALYRLGYAGFRSTAMLDNDVPFVTGVLPMTYCALASLIILGDNLSKVDRRAIIAGMRQLQLPDGSFKPTVLGGESDMRLVYCGVAISQLLNDWSGIDQDKCAEFIMNSLSYEGAFGQCPGAEAHGGSTYCAIASLKLMSKLQDLSETIKQRIIRWCLCRFTEGFSGRPNKDDDTCYTFWIGASLVMLGAFEHVEQKSLIDFVLIAQQKTGGLSKVPEFYSDPLHTYLGIAGLSFLDDDICHKRGVNLLKLDPGLNMSIKACAHLDNIHQNWSESTPSMSHHISESAPQSTTTSTISSPSIKTTPTTTITMTANTR